MLNSFFSFLLLHVQRIHLARRLEYVLKRHFQDVLEDKKVLRWRRLEDPWRSWRCLEDMSWRRHEDVLKALWRQTKYLLGISISNKSKCISNISIFHKSIYDNSKANQKCINQSPIISIFVLFWNSSSISILRIKISDDCLVLRNQLHSNSKKKLWKGEAIKTNFQAGYCTNIFKWIVVYSHIFLFKKYIYIKKILHIC